MTATLTSIAFDAGEVIPARYTCDGADVSPPLAWSGVPQGTRSQALICDDPDARVGTWVHWVLYGLPADVRELPEGVPTEEIVFDGIRQGRNDFRRIGYSGPCPPPNGPHRYYLKLYALDSDPGLDPGATKEELLDAVKGHVLGGGQLLGRYQRSR